MVKTSPSGKINQSEIICIAGYRFIPLDELEKKRHHFLEMANQCHLKGTILLSKEGVNLNLAGFSTHIALFKQELNADPLFSNINFHHTEALLIPFKYLKVKIKKEIITMNQPQIDYTKRRAPSLPPSELKKWLDENRDITLLDTRNDYEVALGTFEKATHLHIQHFTQFVAAASHIDKSKPMVMFCTGGIRCEKAALCLIDQGFSNVYQLEGGILNYFAKEGAAHYQGECFIFDDRATLNPQSIIDHS